MDKASSRSSDDDPLSSGRPLSSRVNPKLWWMVVLGMAEAAFLASGPLLVRSANNPPGSSGWIAMAVLCWPMSIAFAIGIVWMAFELVRGEIRANRNGLTWRRGWSGWKSARWEEISDFYTRGTFRSVETPQGKLEINDKFVGTDEIAELISRRAVNAPTHQWGRKGFRSHESWSLSLSTWSKSQKWTAPIMSLSVFSAFVAIIWLSLTDNHSHNDARPLAPLLVICGLLWLVMLSFIWRQRRFAWQHRDEMLHLDAQGLTFSSNENHVEAKWEEVRAVETLARQQKMPCVEVRTDRGDFELLRNSQPWLQFRRVAGEYAPEAMVMLQKAMEEETLTADVDGLREAWSGGEVGVGARVFSFRSRGNRLILVCSWLGLTLIPLIHLLHLQNVAIKNDTPFTTDGALFWEWGGIVLVLGLGWLWFRKTAIWVDGEGLILHSPFHSPRRIFWGEIETCGHDAIGEWGRVNGRKIYFSRFLNPVRHEELRRLIDNRGF